MPIHAENKHRYPQDWKAISAAIKFRANEQCECLGECGLHPGKRCEELNGEQARYAKGYIVLTCAHLDHQPDHNDESNLRAFCQRCHLRYDRDHHDQSRRRRIRDTLEQAGQHTIQEAK